MASTLEFVNYACEQIRGVGEPIEEPPYPGAKPYYMVEDLEDIPLLTAFVEATYEELPMSKPKKKKVKEAIVEGK